MGLFTTDRIEEIKKKSANALSVFRKTVSDLAEVNSAIESEIKTREQEIVVLQTECETLTTVKQENTQFIVKINEFLGTN
jgi:Sec-independent protein translocase protein TatA